MKKKLSVLVIGSLLAISLVGCSNGANSNTSTPSTSNSVQTSESSENQASDNTEEENGSSTADGSTAESTTQNSTSQNSSSENSTAQESTAQDSSSGNSTEQNSTAENSDNTAVSAPETSIQGPEDGDIIITEDGQEIILHEDSVTVIDEESMQITSDGKEELPKYLDLTYTPIDVANKNISSNAIDLSNPVYYTIANKSELGKFVSDYEKTYSLNEVDSGITFNELTNEFDDNYFEYTTLIVIPVKYDKDSESDIGEVTVSDSNYNIQVYASKPQNDNNAAYTCFVIQANKSELGNSKIVLNVEEDGFAVEDNGDT